MPQLDKVTFFSQILIQAFFFSITFVYLTGVVLPKLYYVKKTRQFCLDKLASAPIASPTLTKAFVSVAIFDQALSNSLKVLSDSVIDLDSLLETTDALKTASPEVQQALISSFVNFTDFDLHSSFVDTDDDETTEEEEETQEDLDISDTPSQITQ